MQWLDHKYLGYNYRMDEMSAALGIAQLEKLDFMIKERQKICITYNKYFGKYSDLVQIPQVSEDNIHTWFVYVLLIKNKKIKRDEVIKDLYKIEVATKPYLPSIHLFDFYKKIFKYKRGDFPVSESVSDSAIALPLYIGLKEGDIMEIAKKVIEVIKKHDKRI